MNSLKLLVVDDEADFAEFVVDVAEGMAFEVITISDSSEFATVYSSDIDIFVVDLFMPGVDGIELLRFLANNKSEASVLLMSGKDKSVLHAARELASELGVHLLGFLEKPFLAHQLEALLSTYVPRIDTLKTDTSGSPTLDDLRDAIKNEDLFLVFQPQINIADRQIVGVEALVRWKHPSKGLIPPGYFIPIAEQNGLISDVTSFVTKEALRQQGEWRKRGLDLRMSINMSPKTLDDLDMPDKLTSCATEMGANIFNIVFEVTETALMADLSRYIDILVRLRMKGFNLSIDDFGTGYSSLQQLIRVPFTELKIDQVFIRKINADKECKTIAEISILLAHKLGMHVVAEGIEDEAVWNTLRELGCDEGQGYWMGKPMAPEEIEAWMENWSSQ